MNRPREVVLVGGPALAGAVLAVAVAVAWPGREAFVAGPLWVPVGGLGLLCAAVAGAVLAVRRRIDAVRREAVAAAHADRVRFLLRLDHELKNPLTAIRAGLANLADAASSQPALDSVTAQTVRLGRLVGDLRKLAELESRPFEHAPIDVSALLYEVDAAVRELPAAGQRVVELSVPRAPWPLPPVAGDRDLLFVALHNLATNALKFSQPGDRVEIRAAEEDRHVVVEVADTGLGIPPEEQAHVWEELARGAAARGVPGTGIGLALVRVIVGRHGGAVALRSRPGRGTVVTVRLPALS